MESWHSVFNKSMRKTPPNILELIITLKEDAKFHDLRKLWLNMPAKKRQRKHLDLDQ